MEDYNMSVMDTSGFSRYRGENLESEYADVTPPLDCAAMCREQSSAAPTDNSAVAQMSTSYSSLANHLSSLGFDEQKWSDVLLIAFGRAWHLHRLMLARSPFFQALFQGDWRENTEDEEVAQKLQAPEMGYVERVILEAKSEGKKVVQLRDMDSNVDFDSLEHALAFLYGRSPRLDEMNVTKVLASACFFQLEELAEICSNYMVEHLSQEHLLRYQSFVESKDYGQYGEQVQNACWGFLCHWGAFEKNQEALQEGEISEEPSEYDGLYNGHLYNLLIKLPARTAAKVLISHELFVQNEITRFCLAMRVAEGREREIERRKQDLGGRADPTSPSRTMEETEEQQENIQSLELLLNFEMEVKESRDYFKKLFRTGISYSNMSFLEMNLAKSMVAKSPLEWLRESVTPEEGLWEHATLRHKLVHLYSVKEEAMNEVAGAIASMGIGIAGGDGEENLCAIGSPFRFSVLLKGVLALKDGASLSGPEMFYAGSLWKITVQAFVDEDPEGRRTLGIFLHRRMADSQAGDLSPSLISDFTYCIDYRKVVHARYKITVTSRRGVYTFGSLSRKSRVTRLPAPPKGWGWRSALLYDEIPGLLDEEGGLRIAAAIQLAA